MILRNLRILRGPGVEGRVFGVVTELAGTMNITVVPGAATHVDLVPGQIAEQ